MFFYLQMVPLSMRQYWQVCVEMNQGENSQGGLLMQGARSNCTQVLQLKNHLTLGLSCVCHASTVELRIDPEITGCLKKRFLRRWVISSPNKNVTIGYGVDQNKKLPSFWPIGQKILYFNGKLSQVIENSKLWKL